MTVRPPPPRRLATTIAGFSTAGVVGLGAGASAAAGTSALAAGAVLGALAVAAGVPDMRDRRIPNRVVAAGLVAAAVIGLAVAVLGDRPVLGGMLAGSLVAAGPLLVGHLVKPDGIGFGDVKLAVVLGALAGVVHWVLGAVLLGAASLLGLAGAAAFRGWRRSIPFGVCLGAGAVLALGSSDWLHETWGLW